MWKTSAFLSCQSARHSATAFLRSERAALLLALALGTEAATEPRTGIGFPDKYKGGVLKKLGVRTKGPIKVYCVGEYDSGTYMLKMSYGVSASKMSSAMADALKPRC